MLSLEDATTTAFGASCTKAAHQTHWEARSSLQALTRRAPCVNQTVRYVSKHCEFHQNIRTTLILNFRRDIRGWKISGTGRQTSGIISSFRILDGFLSDGGRAYWIEQHNNKAPTYDVDRQSRNGTRQVLVKGSFETANNFYGVRLSQLGNSTVENHYEVFQRDEVLKSGAARHVPLLLLERVTKRAHDEHFGVTFMQRSNGPTIISELVPDTILGESRLAVGMPVVLINQQRVESPHHATEILCEAAQGIISIVAFRDESVFYAPLASRLMSTILYKHDPSTKTGLTFRKKGDALFISSVKEGSMAEEAGLEEFYRVWAINDQSYFESSQAAANLILRSSGYIHLVTDPTGSVDHPIILGETTENAIMADVSLAHEAPGIPLVPNLPFDIPDSSEDQKTADPESGETTLDFGAAGRFV